MTADEIIHLLGLECLPQEGGFFRQLYQSPIAVDGLERSSMSSIYYLLKAGAPNKWHRVKSAEIFHHYAGDSAQIYLINKNKELQSHALGTNFDQNPEERPQVTVPPHLWQAAEIAEPKLGWSLMGCTLSPGFEWEDFELVQTERFKRDFPAIAESHKRFL